MILNMGTRKTRKAGTKSTGWIRDTVLRIYTADQVAEDWNAVTPADRLKLVASWVPKELKVDNNSTFQLIIKGLEHKVIDRQIISTKALDAHEDDV